MFIKSQINSILSFREYYITHRIHTFLECTVYQDIQKTIHVAISVPITIKNLKCFYSYGINSHNSYKHIKLPVHA